MQFIIYALAYFFDAPDAKAKTQAVPIRALRVMLSMCCVGWKL